MFGETVSSLILYLAPKSQSDLDTLGFTASELAILLDEKARIVFSFLPPRYRDLYRNRVYRYIAVEFAIEGQTQVAVPFPAVSNAVGYKNPTGQIEDVKSKNLKAVSISEAGGIWSFAALSKGDMLIVDFDLDMSSFAVPELAWATKALAAVDILQVFSEHLEDGSLLPRIQREYESVWNWLNALRSEKIGDRVIIKDFEIPIWNGDRNFANDFSRLSRNFSNV